LPAMRVQVDRSLVFLAFGIAVLLLAAWYVRQALLIVYVCGIFAVVLKPGVDWLHGKSIFGRRPSRGTALLLLIVLLCALVGGMAAIAIPSIVSHAAEFARTMADRSAGLQQRFRALPLLGQVDLSALPVRASAALAKILPAVGGATAGIVSGIVLTAYFILDGAALLARALCLFAPERRARLDATLVRTARRMRRWLAGQVILMVVLGVSSAVTFGLMGLPYFYLLALFAGVANIVPLLGPLVTVLAASAVAATQSGWDVLGVVIFYLVYQQVENAFLTPKIMQSQVQLSSAVVIVALLVGSELAGVAGALVAVPSAVLIAELADEYLAYKPEA
jgi:predicted PurR-regulated permease PerM